MRKRDYQTLVLENNSTSTYSSSLSSFSSSATSNLSTFHEKSKKMIISDVFKIYSPPPTNTPKGMKSKRPPTESDGHIGGGGITGETIPEDIPNIDLCTNLDAKLQYDPKYAHSIMQYKLSIEKNYVFKQTISKQPEMIHSTQHEITKTMYTILIDWLIEIGTISDHTLCLAIHILDEYLQLAVIARANFQLVGCSCLLIASKLEEIHFPTIDDLVTVACNCFTHEDMIQMEQKILQTLNYNIPRPTRSYFLERFLLVSRVDWCDLQARKTFQTSLFTNTSSHSIACCCPFVTSSSSSRTPTNNLRNIPSPTLSALTDEEMSPQSFRVISSSVTGPGAGPGGGLVAAAVAIASHDDSTTDLTQQWITTPTKLSSNETINSLDDIDLTSAESQSQTQTQSQSHIFSQSFSQALSSSASSSCSHSCYIPQHGYIPTNSSFIREEGFARMLLHLTLQDYTFNQYRMSKIAAAIIHLTKQHHRPHDELLWSKTMQFYTGYHEEELIPIIQHLTLAYHTLLSSKYKSILNKFDTKGYKYCCTSVLALSISNLRYDHCNQTTRPLIDLLHASSQQIVKSKNTTPKKSSKIPSSRQIHP